jgi:hypothetical protein
MFVCARVCIDLAMLNVNGTPVCPVELAVTYAFDAVGKSVTLFTR